MKLIISSDGNTWDKIITNFNGDIILEQRGLKLFPEQINVEYFNDWENQMRSNPHFNIVEVERFI